MATLNYIGSELELFAEAVNWKDYWSAQIRPYLRGSVLDVGAGLGATAQCLAPQHTGRWTCLEPDPELAASLAEARAAGRVPRKCELMVGTLADLPPAPTYDSIVYIDVMEHIEHDAAEMRAAMARLNPGGHLIVLSPAHQSLYSPFDKAIGHFRRYSKKTLAAAAPEQLKLVRLRYLDSMGMFLSLGNRLLLKQSSPNAGQIGVWDRLVVPVSRRIDPLLGFTVGKTVIGVWRAGG